MLGLMLLLHYVACALTVAIPIDKPLKERYPRVLPMRLAGCAALWRLFLLLLL